MKLNGTISIDSYLSISKFFLSPIYKLLFMGAVILLDIGFVVLGIVQRDLTWILWIALTSLIGRYLYKQNKKNIINRTIGSIQGIRDRKTFDLDLSFDDDAIRVHNRMTGLDTALSYELFGSMAETDNCIALFVKTGTYLLVPKSNMNAEQHDGVMAILREKCPRLRTRKW